MDFNKIIPLGGKYLFIFYMIISANFISNLFGCQVQQLLHNSMLIKHTLGFLTLYFFQTVVDPNINSPFDKLILSLVIYILFIFSAKMNINFFYGFIVALGLNYIIYIFKNEYKENKELQDYLEWSQLGLNTLAFGLLISGFIYYFIEKKEEYGSTFRLDKFILGNPVCRMSNIPIQ